MVKGEKLVVGTTYGNKRVLATWDFPHRDDKHLQMVLCEYGAQHVTWLYNNSTGSFNHGHYFGLGSAYDRIVSGLEDLEERVKGYNGYGWQIKKVEGLLETSWENYGDVNPIPHGGFWIKRVGRTEYEVVKLCLIDDTKEFIVERGIIDLTDGWIDWNAVYRTCDSNENSEPERKVQDLECYYGMGNFGSSGEDYVFDAEHENVEEEVAEVLKEAYGIILG